MTAETYDRKDAGSQEARPDAARREEDESVAREDRERRERRAIARREKWVDANLEMTFPASDPPSWMP